MSMHSLSEFITFLDEFNLVVNPTLVKNLPIIVIIIFDYR